MSIRTPEAGRAQAYPTLTPGRRPGAPGAATRVRRVALWAALLCLVPVAISYVSMLTQRSDSSLGIRTVEWLRDNGARGLVNRVENIYYSLTGPSTGGPGLKALPALPGAVASAPPAPAARHVVVHRYRPPNIAPVVHPALPGEG